MWPWFSIHSEIKFEKSIDRPDGSLALITYDNTQSTRSEDDIGIYMYPNYESCPPLGVTSPKTIALGEGTAQWGRTDFWDDVEAVYKKNMAADDPDDLPPVPFCKPPLPLRQEQEYYVECTGDEWENCPQKQRDYEVVHGMYSAYAFCAERDGKAVAICVQQMTDDEALAKQIFESFRWTN